MISKKNFSGVPVGDIPVDTDYFSCNFVQDQPVDNAGSWEGVRLFPGDDTPRVFTRCNLLNCEPPPGSTVIDCQTGIIVRRQPSVADTVTIDGVTLTAQRYEDVAYGKYNAQTESYDYYPTPIRYEVD